MDEITYALLVALTKKMINESEKKFLKDAYFINLKEKEGEHLPGVYIVLVFNIQTEGGGLKEVWIPVDGLVEYLKVKTPEEQERDKDLIRLTVTINPDNNDHILTADILDNSLDGKKILEETISFEKLNEDLKHSKELADASVQDVIESDVEANIRVKFDDDADGNPVEKDVEVCGLADFMQEVRDGIKDIEESEIEANITATFGKKDEDGNIIKKNIEVHGLADFMEEMRNGIKDVEESEIDGNITVVYGKKDEDGNIIKKEVAITGLAELFETIKNGRQIISESDYEKLSTEDKMKDIIYFVRGEDSPEPPEVELFLYDENDPTLIVGLTDEGKVAKVLTIPENVTNVKFNSFSLATNGECAFEEINFTKDIDISGAAMLCQGQSNLRKADLSKITKLIPYSCFKDCTGLKEVIFNENLQVLDAFSFNGSGIEEITLPQNTMIAPQVFDNCNSLKTLNINNNLINGQQTLSAIKNININSIKASSGSIYINTPETEINLTIEGNTNFWANWLNVNGDTKIILRDTINGAIIDLLNIESGNGKDAFDGEPIQSIELENSKVFLNPGNDSSYYFANNAKLTDVTLKNNVELIGINAFCGDTNLETVYLENTVTNDLILRQDAFQTCNNLGNIKIKANNLLVEDQTFYRCGYLLDDIYLDLTEVNSIGLSNLTQTRDAISLFNDCPVTQVSLPNFSQRNIGSQWFAYSQLENIYLKNIAFLTGGSSYFTSEYNDNGVFSGSINSTIKKIEFNNSEPIEFIGTQSFSAMAGVENIYFNGDIGIIGNDNITPSNISGIMGSGSASKNNNIIFDSDIHIDTINSYAFSCNVSPVITIPEDCDEIKENAFYNDAAWVKMFTGEDYDIENYVVNLPVKFKDKGEDFDYTSYYGRKVVFY